MQVVLNTHFLELLGSKANFCGVSPVFLGAVQLSES